MRTTLDIEDDVLAAAKELAQLENSTAGVVVSRWARQALTRPALGKAPGGRTSAGFRTIPRQGHIVTNEHVKAVREIEGI